MNARKQDASLHIPYLYVTVHKLKYFCALPSRHRGLPKVWVGTELTRRPDGLICLPPHRRRARRPGQSLQGVRKCGTAGGRVPGQAIARG